MEITEEMLNEEFAPTAYPESEIVPRMEAIAELKGLKVFVFKKDKLKKYFSNINPALGIALMAKNEENAVWNLEHFKRCFLIKLEQT